MESGFVLHRNPEGLISIKPVSSNGQGSFFTRFRLKTEFNEQNVRTSREKKPLVNEHVQPIALFHKKPLHRGAQKILEKIEAAVQSYDPDWAGIKKLAERMFEKKEWVVPANLKIRKAPKYRKDALEAITLLSSDFYAIGNRTDDKRLRLLGILAEAYAAHMQPTATRDPLIDVCHTISNWGGLYKNGHYSAKLVELAGSLREKFGKKPQ